LIRSTVLTQYRGVADRHGLISNTTIA